MTLSPEEKLEALKRIGKMPDGKKRKYDPRIYGPLKAKFLENIEQEGGGLMKNGVYTPVRVSEAGTHLVADTVNMVQHRPYRVHYSGEDLSVVWTGNQLIIYEVQSSDKEERDDGRKTE